MRLFYHPFQPPAGDPLPTEGQTELDRSDLQARTPECIPSQLHFLSEPLERVIEGERTRFYRCICGWEFEAPQVAGPVCPVDAAYLDYLEDVRRAAVTYWATLERKRRVLAIDRRLLREGR